MVLFEEGLGGEANETRTNALLLAGVTGEAAVLEWIRDRLAGSLSETRLADLDAGLRALREASNAGNVQAAAVHAARAAAHLRRA